MTPRSIEQRITDSDWVEVLRVVELARAGLTDTIRKGRPHLHVLSAAVVELMGVYGWTAYRCHRVLNVDLRTCHRVARYIAAHPDARGVVVYSPAEEPSHV